FPANILAAGTSSWDASASRAVRFCGSCWWKRDSRRHATMLNWGALSPFGGTQASRSGQSGRGPQAGHEVVPDVARGLDVRATGSSGRAGEPESFRGQKLDRPLEWAACLPEEPGV